MDPMPKGPILVSALILAAGCGAPAIVDASRQIAELRNCEAAELTVSGAPDALSVNGCGEPAVYALEMDEGWFRSHGVSPGDRLELHPSILEVRPR